MSRPFPTNIQLLDSKKLIKDRAKNKLGLDNTNLPFGWVKGCKMHCKKETDIIGTWFTKTADCVPMWFNLTTFMVGLFIRLVQCSGIHTQNGTVILWRERIQHMITVSHHAT